jgi:hypothetical protein
MLNISHKQTTAYHPESNGAVERLHRRLKDALRFRSEVKAALLSGHWNQFQYLFPQQSSAPASGPMLSCQSGKTICC